MLKHPSPPCCDATAIANIKQNERLKRQSVNHPECLDEFTSKSRAEKSVILMCGTFRFWWTNFKFAPSPGWIELGTPKGAEQDRLKIGLLYCKGLVWVTLSSLVKYLVGESPIPSSYSRHSWANSSSENSSDGEWFFRVILNSDFSKTLTKFSC